MAIYHLHVKTIKRSNGQSSVASAAYRSGDILKDERMDKNFDFSRKQGIIHSEIILPDNAPETLSKRQTLWNEVEQAEKRKDAQLAREIVVALPRELTDEQNIELVKIFTQDNFVNHGMIADIAIHQSNPVDGEEKLLVANPHAHIMLTMRDVNDDGFQGKNRDWNKKEILKSWRINWQNSANDALSDAGSTAKIDHRTLEEQDIKRNPTFHLGHKVTAMENKGFMTKVQERFDTIVSNNQYFQNIREAAQRASDWISTKQEDIYQQYQQYIHHMELVNQPEQEKEDLTHDDRSR